MIIVNPGAGPVDGDPTQDAADANMEAFVRDLEHAGCGGATWCHLSEPTRDEAHLSVGIGDGRWPYRVVIGDVSFVVDMPGLALHRVRWVDTGVPDPRIFEYPRLYVDGNSWLWPLAVSIIADHREETP